MSEGTGLGRANLGNDSTQVTSSISKYVIMQKHYPSAVNKQKQLTQYIFEIVRSYMRPR